MRLHRFTATQFLPAFLSGALVGACVRVRFRRAPRRSIPADVAGQAAWLWETWGEHETQDACSGVGPEERRAISIASTGSVRQ